MNVNEYKSAEYWQHKREIDDEKNLDLAIFKVFAFAFLIGIVISGLLFFGCLLDFILY